ncbi:GTPase [Noviherbaspirillum galbum]|uniref:GTPase n=1 Tax=Noviherbaspirillum galbum TaxID=2709383 RepID=A0A6B3SSU3_9BURK|nr:GTPase [Noviherbaspirillum galbum]NEX63833.1 GTPase [Noviherbaspirillum galbum]
MIPLTLVTGGNAAAREAAIAAALDSSLHNAVILEGLPAGPAPLAAAPRLHVSRIAPGCLCCTGNLTLRVTLNRVLRTRPEHLFIAPATTGHLDALRAFLLAPPYDELLKLTQDLSL